MEGDAESRRENITHRRSACGGASLIVELSGRAFHPDKLNLDILTPSHPLSRSLDLPVCLARFPSARLWLKDESLEDSANLPDPDVIAAEIDSQLPICLPFGLPVHVVRSRDLHC